MPIKFNYLLALCRLLPSKSTLRMANVCNIYSDIIDVPKNKDLRSRLMYGFLLFLFVANCEAAPHTAPDPDPLISVDIESSRPQLVAGEALGVVARIKNISKSNVYIREDSFTLTLPLELEGKFGNVNGYYAYFPTETHEGTSNTDYYKGTLKLDPGDTYSAFWTRTNTDYSSSQIIYVIEQITTQFQYVFFYPGKYSITLTAKYWTDPTFPSDKYRTLTKNIVLPVVAPLFVILFGASLGGLIAYFILPQTKGQFAEEKSFYMRALKRVPGMLGSALLSVIVTIVLSRVSETQFLISVTINDVWGAIVTGFAANYAGIKILEKLNVMANPGASIPNTNKASATSIDNPP